MIAQLITRNLNNRIAWRGLGLSACHQRSRFRHTKLDAASESILVDDVGNVIGYRLFDIED